jgi:hypothetical protein
METTTNQQRTRTFEEIDAESRRIQREFDRKERHEGQHLVSSQISDRAVYYFTNGSIRRGYDPSIE